jgi:hypothetical protein
MHRSLDIREGFACRPATVFGAAAEWTITTTSSVAVQPPTRAHLSDFRIHPCLRRRTSSSPLMRRYTFLVQFIDLLVRFFVVTVPDLLGDFIDLV